ncbi:MAG: HEAT repeat domain-containing protein [Cyanobacteria bacterium]|nr:HEAT repeat domain-containing protein [Cyanobacteriota bacterium]MDA0864888.1 HEAT repeat domain-containing protein [Cyanobacteriota bacterium]
MMSPALDHVLTDLVAGDFRQRWEAIKQLPAFGNEAIAPLLALLTAAEEAEDEELQWFIVRSLGSYDHPQVMAVLVDILMAPADEDLNAAAIMALAQLGEASIAAVMPLLQRVERRAQAVQILACLHTSNAVAPLLSVIDDNDPAVRAQAISALGAFQSPEILPALLVALKDPVVVVRREAAVALGRDRERLGELDWIEHLGQCLWDVDLSVRQAAASALGHLGVAGAVPHLAKVLKSPHQSESLKLSVIRSLGWIDQETALNILIATWDDGSESLRLAIVEAIGRSLKPQLRQQSQQCLRGWLALLLGDPHGKGLKQSLALTLGRWQDQASISLLQQLATDLDQQVQAHAAAALRLMGLPSTPGPADAPPPLATFDTKS